MGVGVKEQAQDGLATRTLGSIGVSECGGVGVSGCGRAGVSEWNFLTPSPRYSDTRTSRHPARTASERRDFRQNRISSDFLGHCPRFSRDRQRDAARRWPGHDRAFSCILMHVSHAPHRAPADSSQRARRSRMPHRSAPLSKNRAAAHTSGAGQARTAHRAHHRARRRTCPAPVEGRAPHLRLDRARC